MDADLFDEQPELKTIPDSGRPQAPTHSPPTADPTDRRDARLTPGQLRRLAPGGDYARDLSQPNNRAPARTRQLANAAARPPITLPSSPYDYTTPHRGAEIEAIELIRLEAKKAYPGVPVAVVPRNTPLAKLPKHEIVLEPEYRIERGSKRYRDVPADQLPPGVYSGFADVVEFIPQRHEALIWEVKKATVGGTPIKAAERAAADAVHYVGRFDVSAEARAAGYSADLGTEFLGTGPVYDTRFDRPGAVLYGKGRTREPRPVTEPHLVPWGAFSLEAYLAFLAALAAAAEAIRRGGGWPAPEPAPGFGSAPSPFGRPIGGLSPLLQPDWLSRP